MEPFPARTLGVMLALLIVALQPVAGTSVVAWTVKRTFDRQTNQALCHLESDPMSVNDGYQDIEASMRIHDHVVRVDTESPLDTGFSDIGLQVDNHDIIHLDQVASRKTALFTANYARIIQQFKAGHHVRVQLRFWPTWPATGTHSVTFSLIGFTKAYGQMQTCAEE